MCSNMSWCYVYPDRISLGNIWIRKCHLRSSTCAATLLPHFKLGTVFEHCSFPIITGRNEEFVLSIHIGRQQASLWGGCAFVSHKQHGRTRLLTMCGKADLWVALERLKECGDGELGPRPSQTSGTAEGACMPVAGRVVAAKLWQA